MPTKSESLKRQWKEGKRKSGATGKHWKVFKKRTLKMIEKLREITLKRWENPEYRKLMSEKHKGQKNNLGKHWKIKDTSKMEGKKAWNKGSNGLSGANSPNWKGGITKIDRLCRGMKEYYQWRSDVFLRDNWICQTCGKRGCFITPHHIKGWNKIIRENNIKNIIEARNCKEMWEINNGVTLCEDCHKLTDNYRGRGQNK